MARRGAPALYELLRKQSLPGAPAPTEPSKFELRSPHAARAGSAHMVQIPMMWVGVAVLAAVALIFTAYTLGARNGGGSTQQLAGPGTTPETGVVPRAVNPPPASNLSNASRTGITPATDNNGDPRTKGYKYFVLAHPSSERASAMVEFCRANGLDAYLVPDDNAMLRKIVVLPGYRDSSEKNSEVIKTLERNIRAVGDKWKSAQRGNKDFSDAYPEVFR